MSLSVEQLTRIAVAFARSTATPGPRLCGACVAVLGVSGAGITVMDGEQAGPLCVSNERMGALEDFQYTTGEGPCRDAYRQRLPVLIADLSSAAASRWPGFVSLADSSGICAVFAYPLAVDGATMGVLTLYQDTTGALSAVQHEDSLALAEVLTLTMLSWQEAAQGELPAGLHDAVAYRAQIHQATGMVAVQLQVPPREALMRIRAYAYAHSRSVDELAADIVSRRVRLADDRSNPTDGA